MAGSIKIQHGGTAATPQAGFSTLWVSSTDGEFYYTKPDGTTDSLIGQNGVTGAAGATGTGGVIALYGAFASNVSQTNAGATAANAVTYNVTEFSNGISIVDNSKITIANGGTYDIQFSFQVQKNSGGDDAIDIWLSKNGSNVADSNTRLTLSANPDYAVAAWNFLVQANAGDYYQIYWSSADTTMQLHATAAGTDPVRPAIPSVILSVAQVTYTQVGATGAAGSSGTSGTSGLSGTSGTSGTSGANGSSGTSGTSGANGSSGTSGTSGSVGPAGSSGTSGTSGSVGPAGSSGTSGTSGTSGEAGATGPAGPAGSSGTSGTSGLDGSSGTSGTSGSVGPAGSSGTSGTSGINGSSGTSGTSGADGSSGTSGTSGVSGSSGTSGTSGADGSSGTSGTSGLNGSSGTSGTSGADGSSGTSGTSGAGTEIFNGADNRILTSSAGGTGAIAESNLTFDGSVLGVTGQGVTWFYDNGNFTGTGTVNFNNSNNQGLTLTGSTTLTFSNGKAGANYLLKVIQGGSGSYTITWPGSVSWLNGAPTLQTTPGAVDIVSFFFDGTTFYGAKAPTNGTSGTSGTSGLNGSSGTSGTSGINGTSGTSGINGSSGTSGTSGTSFSSPYTGNLVIVGQALSKLYEVGTVGSTATINFNNGNIQDIVLGASSTFTFSNGVSGGIYTLQLTQGGAGSYTVTWPGDVIWPSNTPPTLQTAVGAIDFVSFKYGPTGYYGFSGSGGGSGSSGTSGTSGTSGLDGSSGTSGLSGSSGTSGTSGSSGVNIVVGRTVTAATDTLSASDAGTLIYANRGVTGTVFTIPINTFNNGDVVTIEQGGTGPVILAVADGTKQTISPTRQSIGQYQAIQMVMRDDTTNAEKISVFGGVTVV